MEIPLEVSQEIATTTFNDQWTIVTASSDNHACASRVLIENIANGYSREVNAQSPALFDVALVGEWRVAVRLFKSSKNSEPLDPLLINYRSPLPHLQIIVAVIGLSQSEHDNFDNLASLLPEYVSVVIRPFNFSAYSPHVNVQINSAE